MMTTPLQTDQLQQLFINCYGNSEEVIRIFFAPGRVNLIGEHVDYNGGHVLPCALSLGTYIMARHRPEKKVCFISENFKFKADIPFEEWGQKVEGQWVNYPLGIIDQFMKRGLNPGGLQLLFYGDMPNSAGLSSSASVEMVTAVMLNDMFDFGLPMIDMVKMAQKAENEFVGVNCGIMDQFASGMAKADHAVYLDCTTLDYQLVPLVLGDYKLVIANTNKPRKLADSKYNERRRECELAAELISAIKPIKLLSEVTLDELEMVRHAIHDETIYRRARHVITEIHRTNEATRQLKDGNLIAFGALMDRSHDSLRDDYEVTGKELDTLVEEARNINSTIGSRMTGAGFGGCTVNLVATSAVNRFIEDVGRNYHKRTGLQADFYLADPGDGAKRIR